MVKQRKEPLKEGPSLRSFLNGKQFGVVKPSIKRILDPKS